MRTRIAIVGVALIAFLVGWFVGADPPASAQVEPAPEERMCFEIYDPSNQAELLLDRCTGDSWWYDDGAYSGTEPQWRRIAVGR